MAKSKKAKLRPRKILYLINPGGDAKILVYRSFTVDLDFSDDENG